MMLGNRLIALAAVAAALTLGPAAVAEATPPTLVSVGQSAQHLTATWTLPPGVESDEVEYSRSPTTASDGSLESFFDTESLSPRQTSWRSEERVSPGTWYIHVSGFEIECVTCPVEQWSNVLSVVVPVPIAKAGKYSGRTDPAGKKISFTLAPNLRTIRRLTFSYELRCTRGGFPTGELRGTVTHLLGIPVHRDGSFSRLIHYPLRFRRGPSGSATITVKGRLRPPTRATGTLRARAALGGRQRCRDTFGTESWSAIRR